MAYFIGQAVGGLLIITIIAIAFEKALYQRVFDDPVNGKLSSVASAYLLCSVLAGFGMADGGPYAWRAFLIYAIPALLIGLWFYSRGVELRNEIEERPYADG